MIFENMALMLLLMVPFAIFSFLVLTNKEGVERVFSKETLERIKVEGSGLSSRVRNIIFFIAIFFMILAIGRPSITKGEIELEVKALNLVMAIDISASMRSKDRYPNRLEFAKLKIKELLSNLDNDDIIILTFSYSVYLLSPMTNDKETLKEVIDGIDSSYIQGGSDFTALGSVLAKVLNKKEPKIAVLITDGGNEKELEKFKNIIKKENIKLYTIFIGTKKGAPILDSKEKAILKNDKIIMSKLNKELGLLSTDMGGDYIIANYSGNEIKQLASKIDSNIARDGKKRIIKVKDRVELFYYPLAIATIILLFAFSSIPTKKEFLGKKNRVKAKEQK